MASNYTRRRNAGSDGFGVCESAGGVRNGPCASIVSKHFLDARTMPAPGRLNLIQWRLEVNAYIATGFQECR